MSERVNVHPMENPDHKGSGDAGAYGQRSMGNGRNGNGPMSPQSPLKKFGQAKKHINEIFKDIMKYICAVETYVKDIEGSGHVEGINCADEVKEFREKVSRIMEVSARDHMKVVFCGRTSHGKSTTINAMLCEKLLPMGIGHITNCFLQVEGSDTQDGYLLTEEEPDRPKSVQSIKQLASALSNVKLNQNSLIRILWPKQKCRLLREDVVLMDSPGIDITPDLDLLIDKFCCDADVFVLVCNAVSTLMQADKNFFHKVSAKLSKPNLFILQNHWDISAFEDDVEEVKQLHLDRNIQFLCDELNVIGNKKEGFDRVFFVSAREVLAQRLKEAGTPTPTWILQEGFQERTFNFANFERQLEDCLYSSAVRTKFEKHITEGKIIVTELGKIMDEIYRTALKQIEQTVMSRRELADELDYMERQMFLLTTQMEDKIISVVEDVERKVLSTLNDELRSLAILVDEFDRPFHSDQTLLNLYKKEMHEHVEQGLGRNVQSRCSATIMTAVEAAQKQMTERLSAVLPEEGRQQVQTVMPKRDFEIACRLDCRNLCADFCEDISFHFSLSPMNLFRRMMIIQIPRRLPMTPQEPYQFVPQDNDTLTTVLTLFWVVGQRAALGGLIATGVVYKAMGWKKLAIGLILYGGVFCYERLTWTAKAKERLFKQQYVDYASSKLRLIVDLTSSNCSHQVQQELKSTFAWLCSQADNLKEKKKEGLKKKDTSITKMQFVSCKAKSLRNKADWLDKALGVFQERHF